MLLVAFDGQMIPSHSHSKSVGEYDALIVQDGSVFYTFPPGNDDRLKLSCDLDESIYLVVAKIQETVIPNLPKR